MMTNKFLKMCELYRIFAADWDCDFSEKAKEDMFVFESTGKGNIDSGIFSYGNKPNGFAVGKKWLNVTVSMWREAISRGGIYKDFLLSEPRNDSKYFNHRKWLNSVLNGAIG